ncbi:hypothetical protein, partial [Paenirhodobacter populi]|uniref:hypothetical protein n=1 Tax=Paenirhodobacter populi TaxID=2306993 RepID=UPI0019D4488F
CPIRTSTCRNFETISSGFGRLFAILDPPFPKHNSGPLQWGRITPVFKGNLTFPRPIQIRIKRRVEFFEKFPDRS